MNNCIFIAFDDVYFPYAKACLVSLAQNYSDHPPTRVLYVGKSPRVLDFLSRLHKVEILDHKLNLAQFENLNLGPVGSSMAYARFLMWSDLFANYDNVLYLDCDTLVLLPFPEVFKFMDFFCVSDNSDHGIFSNAELDNCELSALLREDCLA